MGDPTKILVLAGPLCAGKSTLADGLTRRGWSVVTARSAIESLAGRSPLSRAELQRIGLRLEAERPGLWLSEAARSVDAAAIVVDSARTHAQVAALRQLGQRVVVAFVTATQQVRRARFEARSDAIDAGKHFEEIASTRLELEAESIAANADIALDTSAMSAAQAIETLLERLVDDA